MAVVATSVSPDAPQLRPLNIWHDLPEVADLVEQCFGSVMDAEGREHLQRMREVARDRGFLRWASRAVETVSLPLAGCVWEENGEIVGNVSVIPYRYRGQRIYLLANIAVREDFRRRGIGRALTLAGVRLACQRRADAIWLQVRADNAGAMALYESLGFRERARRTLWQATPDRQACTDGLGVTIAPRAGHLWRKQEQWLRQLYPETLAWYPNQGLPWTSLGAGLGPALYRFWLGTETRQWAGYVDKQFVAALAWQADYGRRDRLWAAIPPEGGERALTALLLHARRNLTWRRSLALDFPADRAVEAIQAAGFQALRTLLWMQWEATSAAEMRML